MYYSKFRKFTSIRSTYNLFCDSWNDQENLEFNALLSRGIPMNTDGYVDNATSLVSIAPTGNLSIIMMIKKSNMHQQ